MKRKAGFVFLIIALVAIAFALGLYLLDLRREYHDKPLVVRRFEVVTYERLGYGLHAATVRDKFTDVCTSTLITPTGSVIISIAECK